MLTLYKKIGVYLNLDQLSYESFNSSPFFAEEQTQLIVSEIVELILNFPIF